MIFRKKAQEIGKEIATAAIETVKTESTMSGLDILKKVTPFLGLCAIIYWADRRAKDVSRVVLYPVSYPRF